MFSIQVLTCAVIECFVCVCRCIVQSFIVCVCVCVCAGVGWTDDYRIFTAHVVIPSAYDTIHFSVSISSQGKRTDEYLLYIDGVSYSA